MIQTLLQGILLIVVILLLVMLARKLKVAYPIVLVLGGLIISLFASEFTFTIEPEMIFVIFLPPLLFEAAWQTSWKELWRWRRVVSSFAFLIVIMTSFLIAIVSNALIPGFTLALGFLLGGIISPPDAVSATSILENVKVPRRLSSILEGESLLNDASSLIIFRFALIAVGTGQFVFHQAALSFVLVIVMGIFVGVAIGMIYYAAIKWLPTTSNMDIVLSITAPYMMYITAETFHFSGVLAVVSGGLFLSAQSHRFLKHRSRLQAANVWSALSFVLNGLVFMLIGLELPVIIRELGPVSLSSAIGYGILISLVLMISRLLATQGAAVFTVFISRYITTADNKPGWRLPLMFGWAGMRGVVSLAAALSIPIFLDNGKPFPQRNLILFITFVVILFTLVVQGLTLPWLIKLLHVEDPDHYLSDEEQDIFIRNKLSEEALKFLEEEQCKQLGANLSLQQLKARFQSDRQLTDHAFEAEQEKYRKVHLELIRLQNVVLLELNRHPEMSESVIRKHQSMLDLEEEKLRMKFE